MTISLRKWVQEDAPILASLLNDERIYQNTYAIPFPYTLEHASSFIEQSMTTTSGENFGIVLDSEIIGGIGYVMNPNNHAAEIGYWIAANKWDNGYATQATALILKYLFEEINVNKVFAYHYTENPASGKVMIKNHMVYEGILRENIYKQGKYYDVAVYSILKKEYAKSE